MSNGARTRYRVDLVCKAYKSVTKQSIYTFGQTVARACLTAYNNPALIKLRQAQLLAVIVRCFSANQFDVIIRE